MIGKSISHYKIVEEIGRGGNFPTDRDKSSRWLNLQFLGFEYDR